MATKRNSLIFSLGFSTAGALGIAEGLAVPFFVGWFTSVNIVNFLLMGKDKLIATSKASALSRTPEQTFFTLALLGGFPGLFGGRKLFNHKTTKTSFVITMWLLFMLQIGASAVYAHYNGWSFTNTSEKPTAHQRTDATH